MSYSSTGFRKPVRNRSQMLSSGVYTTKLKKKKRTSKQPWDDSVNDLTVHKPSTQELQRNHQLHQPKKDHERLLRKIESSKAFIRDADNSSYYVYDGIPSNNFSERNGALSKEIFYNHEQERELLDLLSETDKTIGEVQDMFGDNIYKHRGITIVTKAPNHDGKTNIAILNPQDETYYDTLSESVVRQHAQHASGLSDEGSIGSLSEEEDAITNNTNSKNDAGTFKTKVNLDHYQKLLTKNSDEMYQGSNDMNLPNIESLSQEFAKSIKEDAAVKTVVPKKDSNNNAKKLLSTKNTTANALQTFDDMKKVLDTLEGEISEYEKETGKESATENVQVPSTLSGYTANLLSVIIRLTNHLKQSEIQLKAEMVMRKEILDMFEDQRNLVDILTSNLLEVQETNEILRNELHSQQKKCQTNYANLKLDFVNLEKRFNLALFDPNSNISKRNVNHSVKVQPLQDITNYQPLPTWTENDQ